MNQQEYAVIEVARWLREHRDLYMKEFLVDEVDARDLAQMVLDIEMNNVTDESLAQMWKQVREAWPNGEQTGRRLASLVLHYLDRADVSLGWAERWREEEG